MFYGLETIMKHMEEKHPQSLWFGDNIIGTLGEITSQKCQICGEELVKMKEVTYD